MKGIRLVVFTLIWSNCIFAQNDSVDNFKFTGFVDAYYTINSSGKQIKDVPYSYNHSRNQELNVNLALIHGRYSTQNVRANLGLQAGTYTINNYSAEPTIIQHIYDANAGVRLFGNWWLDAGIFGSSHVGFESAISKENWTLTRSICAENTPYYEAAAELNYESKDGKLLVSLMVLNGWQVITDNNTKKGFGYQINYKPSEKWSFNASSYVGEGYNLPNSNSMRYFHHCYVTRELPAQVSVAAIFDIGLQEEIINRNYYNLWYNPTILLRKKLGSKWAICGRSEYYHDPANVIISTINGRGFETLGYSLNLDYTPFSNVWLRIEGKQFNSKNPVFLKNGLPSKTVNQLVVSLAVSF